MFKWAARAALVLCALLGLTACQPTRQSFSGERALEDVRVQCEFGPRPVGSEASEQTSAYIADQLQRYGWEVEYQDFAYGGLPVRNVIGKKGSGPLIILGAHYDTRPVADQDPTDRAQPVMGANDGASGVAVLLELARVLDAAATDQAEIWLVFFDAEDRGKLNAWPWCVGSDYFASQLTRRPEYVIVVDMVGDSDQQFYYEWNSTLWLQERLWQIAKDKGYERYFVPEHKYSIVDDHTPFLQYGYQAVDIIDFDYPYWHTRYDTLDRISADSLQRVGDVLQTLLEGQPFAASALVEDETADQP